jgi:hypothetical protein
MAPGAGVRSSSPRRCGRAAGATELVVGAACLDAGGVMLSVTPAGCQPEVDPEGSGGGIATPLGDGWLWIQAS